MSENVCISDTFFCMKSELFLVRFSDVNCIQFCRALIFTLCKRSCKPGPASSVEDCCLLRNISSEGTAVRILLRTLLLSRNFFCIND